MPGLLIPSQLASERAWRQAVRDDKCPLSMYLQAWIQNDLMTLDVALILEQTLRLERMRDAFLREYVASRQRRDHGEQ